MNISKIFFAETIRNQERIDEHLRENVNKCPVVIVSFILNERKRARETGGISDFSISKISSYKELLYKWIETQEKLLKKIEEKGVCTAIGEIEIKRIVEKDF